MEERPVLFDDIVQAVAIGIGEGERRRIERPPLLEGFRVAEAVAVEIGGPVGGIEVIHPVKPLQLGRHAVGIGIGLRIEAGVGGEGIEGILPAVAILVGGRGGVSIVGRIFPGIRHIGVVDAVAVGVIVVSCLQGRGQRRHGRAEEG
ncbi:MAG: hypothetical protein AB7Q64_24320, partial [Verrucomicrobiales bacterium]